MDALAHYSWPGNVRELEHLIERTVLLSPGKELRVPLSELKSATLLASGENSWPSSSPLTSSPSSIFTLQDAEHQHILRASKQTHWRIGGTKRAAVLLAMK